MVSDGPASQRQRTSRSARPSRGRGRGQGRCSASGWLNTECVPTISLRDFHVGEPLGHGPRGTTFRATWKGKAVAVKLFDTHKNNGGGCLLARNQGLSDAYLSKAWGQLVPTPKFVCEAFGVLYFGMQLAEDPPESASAKDWDNVLQELEEKYFFRHLDVEGSGRGSALHNRMMLRDSAGRTRPILIDLD